MREAELTLSQRETELSRLTGAVDDHLALADLLKAEIVSGPGTLGSRFVAEDRREEW
jgi:hypothetical protein